MFVPNIYIYVYILLSRAFLTDKNQLSHKNQSSHTTSLDIFQHELVYASIFVYLHFN